MCHVSFNQLPRPRCAGAADVDEELAEAAEAAENEEEEEEEDELLGRSSSAGAALLRDTRRLCEETLGICRPDHRPALRCVPEEGLLRLLRLLQGLIKGGAGLLLEPGDSVGAWGMGAGVLVCWVLECAGVLGAGGRCAEC
jgi:hypothetical protein